MRELKRHGKILDMKYHKFTLKTLLGDPVNLSYCSYACPIITRLAHTLCVCVCVYVLRETDVLEEAMSVLITEKKK